MEETLKKQAVPYEGEIPKDWEFIGMRYNDWYWFRDYKAPDGTIYFTSTKRKKGKKIWIDCRKDDQGREFARRRFKRRMYER